MKKQKKIEESTEPTFTEGCAVLFHEYGETKEHEGVVLDCPDEGKLTVEFETLGTLKINRCYLRPAQ